MTPPKKRNESKIPPVLLSGLPGRGKTKLSSCIAQSFGGRLYEVLCSNLNSKDELIAILTQLKDGDVLLLDELHGLKLSVDEYLYGIFVNNEILISQGNDFECLMNSIGVKGQSTKVTYKLPSFSIVGCTTRRGDVSPPLLSRFRILNLVEYSQAELTTIISNYAKRLGFDISQPIARAIAQRSRSPRVAKSHTNFFFDYVTGTNGKADIPTLESCFTLLGINEVGLTMQELEFITLLVRNRTPVSLSSIASSLGETEKTILELEDHLIRQEFIARKNKGRIALEKSYELLNTRKLKVA